MACEKWFVFLKELAQIQKLTSEIDVSFLCCCFRWLTRCFIKKMLLLIVSEINVKQRKSEVKISELCQVKDFNFTRALISLTVTES